VPPELGTVAGTETVLVAEDDPLLLPLARDVLKRLGYTVLEARTPADAMAVAQAHKGINHLLVSDVVMPGESGLQLARRLLEVRPNLRVLYISGYSDEAIVRHGLLDPGTIFLQKPFSPAALARKVRELLDAPRPGAS
jgi:CheY-like chemotaxis protein